MDLVPPIDTSKPPPFEVRLRAEPTGDYDEWTVDLVMQDRPGLLAAVTGVLAGSRVSVIDAQIATSTDRIAVDRFRVLAAPGTDWDAIRRRIEAALAAGPPKAAPELIEGGVVIDNEASPAFTVIELRAADRAGLLHRVARAMAGSGVEIHQANIATQEGMAIDTFYVTTRRGSKLDECDRRALQAAFAGTRLGRWWSLRRLFGLR